MPHERSLWTRAWDAWMKPENFPGLCIAAVMGGIMSVGNLISRDEMSAEIAYGGIGVIAAGAGALAVANYLHNRPDR